MDLGSIRRHALVHKLENKAAAMISRVTTGSPAGMERSEIPVRWSHF